jgi:hypothetical protein
MMVLAAAPASYFRRKWSSAILMKANAGQGGCAVRLFYRFTVTGGSSLVLAKSPLAALQWVVALLGADAYPLFLRLGAAQTLRLQPVTAGTLLAEVEHFKNRLVNWRVPGISFRDDQGQEIGRIYARPEEKPVVKTPSLSLAPTTEGIHLLLKLFPPPVGFRSRPELAGGQYECYFRRLLLNEAGSQGERTTEMGGSGSLVTLPAIPIPPVTQWDFALVAGKPVVREVLFMETPALEVFLDPIHLLTSICVESLRLMAPLTIIKE